MLAESVHSVADSGNQLLLLLGRRRARREETEEHQFGFGQERYFYAFIVAVVLFVVGALFSVYEGIERIRHPGDLTSPVVAIIVLVIAIGLESFSLPDRGRPVEPLPWSGRLAGVHPARQGAGAAGRPAGGRRRADRSGLGDARGRAGVAHAQRPLGRRGLARHRHPARLRRRRPGGRDEEPADRGVGAASVEATIVTAIEGGPEVDCVIHLRTYARRPGDAAGRGQDRRRGRDTAARSRPASTRPSAGSGPPCRSPRSSSWSPTSIRRPRTIPPTPRSAPPAAPPARASAAAGASRPPAAVRPTLRAGDGGMQRGAGDRRGRRVSANFTVGALSTRSSRRQRAGRRRSGSWTPDR